MYLHLGGDAAVAEKDIISIHDYAIFHRTENREFMRQLEASGDLVQLADKEPKSLVITVNKAYLSAISSVTLRRRAGMVFDIDDKY